MSRSRAKGTTWETAIVNFLRDHGAPHAERRALGGTKDRGDIAGVPGVVFEAKNAAKAELGVWLAEAEAERVNDRAELAVVWHKRRGKASAGDGYVTMDGATLVRLLAAAGYLKPETE
jgi:Holliday junction resolvase